MEEQHHRDHGNEKGKKYDYDDIVFFVAVFVLISVWAYVSNSIVLGVVALLSVMPSVVRPFLPGSKRQKVKIDVEEGDDDADGKPEPSHLMEDIVWMVLIIAILVVLSATGSARYVTLSDGRSHRYESCPEITSYRDMRVYSFPIDVWLLGIDGCEKCRVLRVEERRANTEAEAMRKEKEDEQRYGKRRIRMDGDDEEDDDYYYYYYDDEEDDEDEY